MAKPRRIKIVQVIPAVPPQVGDRFRLQRGDEVTVALVHPDRNCFNVHGFMGYWAINPYEPMFTLEGDKFVYHTKRTDQVLYRRCGTQIPSTMDIVEKLNN